MKRPAASVHGLAGRVAPVPLLALAAAALAALVVAAGGPWTSGQGYYDRTDGRTTSGGLSVGVFADIADAQLEKNTLTFYGNTEVYLPAEPPPTTPTLGTAPGSLTTNDPAYLADPRVAPQFTFFDNALHASNAPAAHNTILITADASHVSPNADGCAVAEVRSSRSGSVITVQLAPTRETPNGSGRTYYQAFVRILDPRDEDVEYESSDGPACAGDGTGAANLQTGAAQADAAAILARHGDRLTVSVQGAGQLSLEVDGEGPELSGIEPAHESALRPSRLDFAFEVRDDDSGLRHDGELVITLDGDYTQVNADRDHDTTNEPLSVASGTRFSGNGDAADIDLQVWRSGAGASAAPDITDTGRWTLTSDRPGVAYAFSAPGNNVDEGAYRMQLTARDRAGNVATTDASFDDDGDQPYEFTVDDTEPRVIAAATGVGYDLHAEKEIADRSSIMLDFGEPVRGSMIDPELVAVAGHRLTEIIYLTGRSPLTATLSGEIVDDPRSRIYLRLDPELGSDETPDIVLLGGLVQDLAGNLNDSQTITAEDGLAPRFEAGVIALAEGETLPSESGDEGGRPIVNGRGEFVVDVRSDEELRRRPVVYFVGIGAEEEQTESGKGTGDYVYSIRSIQTGASITEQEDALHWRRAYKASGLGGLGALVGVVVYALDDENNAVGTPGWTPRAPQNRPPAVSDALDLEAMDEAGLLLELDREFNGGAAPDLRVAPPRGQAHNETESANPFVSIRFTVEGEEYAACPSGGCGGDNPDAEFADSHGVVRISEITLNGADASARLSRVDASQFALAARSLPQGRHEVEYTAVDNAGNEVEGEFAFSVLARSAYELQVSPGWNLISLPGTPADPSLEAVIPPGGRVQAVMSYQEGNWMTAAAEEDGSWHGDLTRIEAGYGYWLFATTFETLAPLIPEPEQTTVPPTVPVRHGWNLLGVVDLYQNPAGSPPGAGGSEADRYFGSIPWRVAYTYDAHYHRWSRFSPNDDDTAATTTGADANSDAATNADDDDPPEIANGKGYWVWSPEPGTLVP